MRLRDQLRPDPDAARALALLAALLLVYAPALGGAPLWDDDRHLTALALRELDGLRRIWTDLGATQQYYPVLHSAFWIERRLWGDGPLGYHLVNVAQHWVSALLLVALVRRLALPGAWLAGALWALHPIQVESVAWITEQKNTLSACFALGAALCWLRYDDARAPRDYAWGTALFVLALATKSVTATVAPALLVVSWWRRGALRRADVLPLLPWVALGAAAGLFTAWVERTHIGAQGEEFALTWPTRVLLAGRIVWHYAATIAWPAQLTFMYPRWPVSEAPAWWWAFPLSVLALLGAAWSWRTRTRTPLTLLLLFMGTLFPVLGFLDVYPFRYAWVADHFAYLASIALLVPIGVWLSTVAGAEGPVRTTAAAAGDPRLARVTAAALLLACAALSWQQAHHYRDPQSLWRGTLAGNPDSWMAHHNLGRVLLRVPGGVPEAAEHFEAALRLKPAHARARVSLGLALIELGRYAEAIPHLERGPKDEPGNAPLAAVADQAIARARAALGSAPPR